MFIKMSDLTNIQNETLTDRITELLNQTLYIKYKLYENEEELSKLCDFDSLIFHSFELESKLKTIQLRSQISVENKNEMIKKQNKK